ncbi:MAG: type II toxin-antitoxin system Phd/YefM family antitoxin [Firmicutes bacterium]|nr:type II toxin-antitoxin system Phd/YefM family antitoxin [Bacillota bacterium]
MTNINVTGFRKELFGYLDQVAKFNEPLNISTKNGNVVVLSEQDYRSLMETLYIESVPGLKARIAQSLSSPRGEFTELGNRTLEELMQDEL